MKNSDFEDTEGPFQRKDCGEWKEWLDRQEMDSRRRSTRDAVDNVEARSSESKGWTRKEASRGNDGMMCEPEVGF